MSGLRSVYNASRPEVHDVLRRWRTLADGYDPHRVLIGETYVFDPTELGSFYGNDDELNLAFNFTLLHSKFNAPALRAAIEEAEQHLPANAWPVWTGGNHDNHRFASRWCGDDPAKIRAAMVMLMGLRGTPFLYYGDEIGMPDTEIPDRPRARSGRRVPRRAWAAIPSARRCRGPASPGAVTATPASSRGSRTATSPRATWPTSATIPIRCSRSPAT